MAQPQSFAHHTRWDPLFHFFVLPVAVAGLIITLIRFFEHLTEGGLHRQAHAVMWIVLAAAALILVFKVRLNSLKVQDRVIRLEERLRLSQLLAEPLRARIPELTEDQLCGLRFASDAEVAKLAERAMNEKLSRTDIKKAIKTWRPDNWRV